ncbi:uncharacterized protein LOC105687434 [Athalia rosae]|uniref:uncharacterized protein LOC105687434 n=1 Tax=Athalia rosae TaxID=37344 RepID=UPI002033729B|nr:uncharacterized protein LOC105687434 [Athalia rosae]
MFGFGIYTFIDNSVLRATWDQNKPAIDVVLRESLGSIWNGLCNDKEIMFTSGNHFWDEISTPEEKSHPDTEVKLDNNEFKLNQ